MEVIGLLSPKYKVNPKQVTSTPLWSYQFVLFYCIPDPGLYLQPLLDLQPGKMGIPAEKRTQKIFDPKEIPDWITHITATYTLCTILGFKYKQFNTNTVITMVGR